MRITHLLLGLLALLALPLEGRGQSRQFDFDNNCSRFFVRSGAPVPTQPGMGRPGAPSGGPHTATGARGGPAIVTLGATFDSWSTWWLFNRESYLDLRRHMAGFAPTSESPEFYLGLSDEIDRPELPRETVRREILPVFLRVLTEPRGHQVAEITYSLIGIARLRVSPRRTLQAITPHLRSSNQQIREIAALSLGILGSPDALPSSMSLVSDDALGRSLVGAPKVDARTRAFAAYGLGVAAARMDEERFAFHRRLASRALVSTLRDDATTSREVRVAALSALGLIPTDAEVLHAMVLPELVGILDDPREDDTVRAHVPTAIARLGSGAEADLLLKRLASPREDRLVRQSLVVALGSIAKRLEEDERERVADALLRLRKHDRSTQERHFALLALGQLGTPKAIEFLKRHVIDGRQLERPWAALAIGVHAHGVPDGSVILVELADAVIRAREKSTSPDLRGAFSIALALIGDQDSEKLLREEMRESRIDEVRGHAAVGLGILAAHDAKSEIHALTRRSETRPALLRELSIALGLLGDREAVPLLLELLEGRANAKRGLIAYALGRIGDVRSLETLLGMAGDSKAPGLARAYALAALGVIGEEGDLPWYTTLSTDVNYHAIVDTLVGPAGVLDLL